MKNSNANPILKIEFYLQIRVLSHNPITHLEPNSFDGLSNLTELWVIANQKLDYGFWEYLFFDNIFGIKLLI